MDDFLPKDLINIVNEYSIDNSQYEKVVRELNKIFMILMSRYFDLHYCHDVECFGCIRRHNRELYDLPNDAIKFVFHEDIFHFIKRRNRLKKKKLFPPKLE
jgi:diketogulonate reductase-like aldo/keto reductase